MAAGSTARSNASSGSRTKRRSQAQAAVSYDWGLLTVVTALVLLGAVMVFSASYPSALVYRTSPFYYILRHLQWIGLGIAALVIAARIPYTVWERWSVPLMGVGLLSLLAVRAFGEDLYGARRTLFGGSVQPSEPMKIILLLYISTWLASKGDRIRDINVGLIPFGVLMGIVSGLIMAQPDISTTALLVASATIVFFLAGAEMKQLLTGGGVALLTFWLVITRIPYARDRITAAFGSIQNPLESPNWQVAQASEAMVKGGPVGAGLGASVEKLPGNLPLGWSDNIFAIIGEELGLIGTLLVIFLFVLLAYRGLRIAAQTPDMFGALLAAGLTTLISLQALLHVAVSVALAPPTGIPLPFVSLGGSSLVTSMGAAG
ncbi:MAG: cell division protein FtsW, partial [Caldilineae bacterium]